MLIRAGKTITPQRSTTEFGESSWADMDPIPNAVVVMATPSSTQSGAADGGKVYMQTGSVFVPRGSDLRDGDRFTYQDKTFGVVGDAQWDTDHPFSGRNLGVVEYAIRLGG